MKKIVFAALLGAFALQGYSQGVGLVNMSNASAAPTTTNYNNGSASGNAMGAGNFYYELLIASSLPSTNGMTITVGASGITSAANPLNFSFTDSTVSGTNTAAGTGGRFSGGSASGVSVPGTLAGVTYYDLVVGWSASLGTTWSAVASQINNWHSTGYFGYSVMGSFVAGGSLAGGGTQPTPQIMSATTIPGFSMFNVTPVPEPGTLALAALGGASLLLFRRRK